MKKLIIENGAVVLVAPSGIAIGVVIRADGKGRAIGAFFGPRADGASDVNLSELRLKDALLICRFGDHGIHTKRWPVIGSIPNWANASWAVTKFSRGNDNPDLCYVTEYDDSLNGISERVLSAAEGKGLPDDAQYGSGVVEAKLAKLVQ